MIIVITPEWPQKQEIQTCIQLLEAGLEHLHIRKYHFQDQELLSYVEAIPEKYRHQLVLHGYFHLAEQLGISRLHLNEYHRNLELHQPYFSKYALSCSLHSLTSYQVLESYWEYAFLSPVHPSISKPGYQTELNLQDLDRYRQKVQVPIIALGGLTEQNLKYTLALGFDGLAFLGHIWQATHPVDQYIKLQHLAHE